MSIQQIQNADELSAHRMIVLPSQGGVRCTEYHYTFAEGALFTVCCWNSLFLIKMHFHYREKQLEIETVRGILLILFDSIWQHKIQRLRR